MTTPSPISLADPDSLSLLFAADPLTLTDADLTALVTELRRRRSEFASAEAAKALKPKSTRTKAEPPSDPAKADKPTSELSLDDL